MAKTGYKLLHIIAWLTGVVVSLSVGFGMVGGTLSLPNWLGGSTVAMLAGWIVVIGSILSVIMVLIDALNGGN